MTKHEKHNEYPEKEISKETNSISWTVGAVLLAILAIAGGLYWNSTLTISDVKYSGLHYLEEQELKEQVEIPTGISPDSLSFKDIISEIEKINYVHQARINVEPSGKLHIQISERKPIALLAEEDPKMYVDKDGLKLPRKLGKAADVPLLYGFASDSQSDTLQSKSFKSTKDFLIAMHEKSVSNATISEIAWTGEEGIVALTNENGVKLIFGRENFENRLRNWEAFYGEIIKRKGMAAMRSVDMRFRDQIVTREI